MSDKVDSVASSPLRGEVVDSAHPLYDDLMSCIEAATLAEHKIQDLRRQLSDRNVTFNALDTEYWFQNYISSIPEKDSLLRHFAMSFKIEPNKSESEHWNDLILTSL
jgi:hypothetical protein